MAPGKMSRRRCISFYTLVHFVFCLFTILKSCHGSDSSIGGRFSFSLTTFDQAGKLRQVERATEAASLGTPVVAVCLSDEIHMACPQVLPSPFMMDDGTARFNRITQSIAVAHAGVSADGRVVTAAAQRMAVEHAYTFDEPIPIESFLEGVSLLFQEYTMEQGARPFGCSLLIAYVPSEEDSADASPRLYRIDPSGSVESMDTFAVIGSLQNKGSLATALESLAKESRDGSLEKNEANSLMRILEDAIGRSVSVPREKTDSKRNYLVASLSPQQGLQVRRESQPSSTTTSSSESKA